MTPEQLSARFTENHRQGRKNIVFHICSLGQGQFHAPVYEELASRNLPAEYWLACDYSLQGVDLRVPLRIPDANRLTTQELLAMPHVHLVMFAEIFGRAPKDAITCFVGHGQPNKHTRWAKENLLSFKHYFLYGMLEKAMFNQVRIDNPDATQHIVFHEIGYPKLDPQLQGRYDRNTVIASLGLDPAKKTILYAPAWDPGASHRTHGTKVAELLLAMGDYNVLTKMHPASMEPPNSQYYKFYTGGKDWRAEFGKLNNPRFRFIDDWVVNPLLVAADLLVTDFSGIALEYLVLDKPVLYIDCPEFYEKTQKEWNNDPDMARNDDRFNAGRNTGYVVPSLGELTTLAARALANPQELSERRKQLAEIFLYNPGQASIAAADTVSELLGIVHTNEVLESGQDRELPFVSIVIPTYNRAAMLGITLESFLLQDYPPDRYEILVVDNNSSDNTLDVVKAWQQKTTRALHYLFEKRQGVHYARNTAAHQTQGELLYYTDDDMIADPRMLREIVVPFMQDPQVASASGKILPHWEKTPPAWVNKLLNNYLLSLNDMGDGLVISPEDPGVFSCHQAMRRDAFFQTAGFHPENTAGEWIGDGETGLNQRLKRLGWKFAYHGKSVTHHMIPPARMTQEYLNKRLANQGNCDSYSEYQANRFTPAQLVERIQLFGARMQQHYLTHVKLQLEDDERWHMELGKVHYWLARGQYELRLIKDPKWVELVLRDNWLEDPHGTL